MLKAARKNNNITQVQLAKKINISQGYISKIERKDKHIRIKAILILEISKELSLCPLEVYNFLFNICDECILDCKCKRNK